VHIHLLKHEHSEIYVYWLASLPTHTLFERSGFLWHDEFMSVNLFDKFAPILVCVVWVWLSIRTTKSLQTITRQTVAHTRRVVWLIKLLATLVAAGNVFGVALDFHLNWFVGAVISAAVVLLALTDKVEAIVPEKPSQHPSAYSEAWKEYRRLRKNSYVLAFFLLLIGVALY